MASFKLHSTTRLFSPSADFGQIEITTSSWGVVLNIEGKHYTSLGDVTRDHAIVDLPIQEAIELRDALTAAIGAVETATAAHPALWPDSALRALAARPRRAP